MAIDENPEVLEFIKKTLARTGEMSFPGKKEPFSEEYILDAIEKRTLEGRFFYKQFKLQYKLFQKKGLV